MHEKRQIWPLNLYWKHSKHESTVANRTRTKTVKSKVNLKEFASSSEKEREQTPHGHLFVMKWWANAATIAGLCNQGCKMPHMHEKRQILWPTLTLITTRSKLTLSASEKWKRDYQISLVLSRTKYCYTGIAEKDKLIMDKLQMIWFTGKAATIAVPITIARQYSSS